MKIRQAKKIQKQHFCTWLNDKRSIRTSTMHRSLLVGNRRPTDRRWPNWLAYWYEGWHAPYLEMQRREDYAAGHRHAVFNGVGELLAGPFDTSAQAWEVCNTIEGARIRLVRNWDQWIEDYTVNPETAKKYLGGPVSTKNRRPGYGVM